MMTEVFYLDLTEISRRIRKRELSSLEVTRVILARIAQLDKQLKSYATITPEIALAQAEAADREIARGINRGPLHGCTDCS